MATELRSNKDGLRTNPGDMNRSDPRFIGPTDRLPKTNGCQARAVKKIRVAVKAPT